MNLHSQILNCTECQSHLPLGPRPVFSAHKESSIVIIGQAPGLAVHTSGIPWDDKSGDNLRSWMSIDSKTFYNPKKIAIVPMGFCYPGKGKSGDNPPRKECALLWHDVLLSEIEFPKLILLIGKYAQDYYLKDGAKPTLTETVKNFRSYLPQYFVLPHPSPRNNIWQKKNEWFKTDVLPSLKAQVEKAL